MLQCTVSAALGWVEPTPQPHSFVSDRPVLTSWCSSLPGVTARSNETKCGKPFTQTSRWYSALCSSSLAPTTSFAPLWAIVCLCLYLRFGPNLSALPALLALEGHCFHYFSLIISFTKARKSLLIVPLFYDSLGYSHIYTFKELESRFCQVQKRKIICGWEGGSVSNDTCWKQEGPEFKSPETTWEILSQKSKMESGREKYTKLSGLCMHIAHVHVCIQHTHIHRHIPRSFYINVMKVSIFFQCLGSNPGFIHDR